ncbi:MAG: hypothetical protein GWP59_00075 [Chlamydiales bacterium]|nr:biopolymer transporter ExbD [Chlamydiales bacterium]NCF70077.1 hypothetical protein [Chlamydiales bacterium]
MSFIPEEEMKKSIGVSLAPMIDFLFLMLVFFASLAVSRVTTKDTEIELVKIKEEVGTSLSHANTDIKLINVSVLKDGSYKWVTELRDYLMTTPEEIVDELSTQYDKGMLPDSKQKTHVLLKVDKQAPWESIAKLIHVIRGSGFTEVRPLYEVDKLNSTQSAQMTQQRGEGQHAFS